jgi:hypothetical protein
MVDVSLLTATMLGRGGDVALNGGVCVVVVVSDMGETESVRPFAKKILRGAPHVGHRKARSRLGE